MYKKILIIILILTIVGSFYYLTKKDKSNIINDSSTQEHVDTEEVPVEEGSIVKNDLNIIPTNENINTLKTYTYKHELNGFTFQYPNDWYVFKDVSSDSVYLVNDPNKLEGNIYKDIREKNITYIEIGTYTDAYTEDILKSFLNPIKFEKNKYLPNKYGEILTWLTTKGNEEIDFPNIHLQSVYVILTEDLQNKMIIGTIRPYDEYNKSHVKAIETVMSSVELINTPSSE